MSERVPAPVMLHRRSLVIGGPAALLAVGPARASEPLWARLAAGDAALLIRHANAPGTGDPPGFRLDDPATQRNLDARGRADARRMGERLRERGVRVSRVLASRWRRCVETAELMALGPVGFAPDALDSFFGQPRREPEARAALLRLLADAPRGAGVLAAVTHQVNITAVAGFVPATSEAAVMALEADRKVRFLGRLSLA
jgi:phosphohistidine phosphatase SixA